MFSPTDSQAPIYDRLCQLQSETVSFHTPGHKQGQRGSQLLANWLPDALGFDLTEVAGLDSIHHPDGPIEQAERLTANLYGAKSTFFTTNGSTAGVIGSLLATAAPGSELLLPRNAHLSVLSALVLGDLLPRFIPPVWQDGRILGITKTGLTEALCRHPSARTLLLVSPSYQGIVGELADLVQLAQASGCLVVVDEAHGAHLPFHPDLPLSAVQAGADLVVQSAHKTLSALTGGAWVHRLTDRLSDERVRSCLNLVQSTSPSWLILGSLDLARQELATAGRSKLDQVLQNAAKLRQRIAGAGWSLWEARGELGFRQDPLKLNVSSRQRGWSGQELAARLAECGVYPEMADAEGVLLMLGLGDISDRYAPLVDCLRRLPQREALSGVPFVVPPLPKLAMRPREAYFAASRLSELSQSVGRVAARPLYVYPPGIPLVYPGEVLDADVVAFTQSILAYGGELSGGKGDLVSIVE